jgi:methionyl-tRNA formyltransferase
VGLTVALYLCTTKGHATLTAACASGVDIAYVVTAPAVGMDDDSHKAIEAECKTAGIPVYLWDAPPIHHADVVIAAGWRRLLDIEAPIVVLHDSILPRYRGFAPMITALVNGEPEIGVTAFMARPEPDTGPIVAQYRSLTREICMRITAGEPIRYAEQEHDRATYSVWRDDDDFRIDWTRDADRICRLVDAASSPFAGAWSTVAGAAVRVDRARPFPDVPIEDRQPGKVFRIDDGMPVVVCGRGLVKIERWRGAEPDTKLKVRFA